MTTRDSSHDAIAELRSLRLARVRERARAEAERRARELGERAESERAAHVERMRAARGHAEAVRQSTARAQRVSRTTIERISRTTIERVSRTTIERIAALRGELEQLASERAQAVRERAERIDALNARLMERRSHWLPIATALLIAGVVFGGLVAQAPAATVASGGIPEAPESFELEREGHGTLDADVSDAVQVALLDRAPVALVDGDAGMPEQPAAVAPEPAPEKKPSAVTRKRSATGASASKAASKPKKARAESPALDPLGNIDGCGDDPICGLGF